jgi:hypothetical protein
MPVIKLLITQQFLFLQRVWRQIIVTRYRKIEVAKSNALPADVLG